MKVANLRIDSLETLVVSGDEPGIYSVPFVSANCHGGRLWASAEIRTPSTDTAGGGKDNEFPDNKITDADQRFRFNQMMTITRIALSL